MHGNTVNINVYSDTNDISSISLVVNQLKINDPNIRLKYPLKFKNSEDDIIILQIESVSSTFVREAVKLKEEAFNKIIFVIKKNDAVLISSLVKLGFQSIFVIPFELPKLITHLSEIINLKSDKLKEGKTGGLANDNYDIEGLVGSSKSFKKVIEIIKKISNKTDVYVMILGETGTGKSLIARTIHANSPKKQYPFIDIVCSAIPESLMESELFGYEAGAFTQAESRKYGLLELAEKGTLFLDELGDISLNIQAKLLRSIEKKVIRRLGGVRDIPIYARFISATNKNLELMIEQKLFRSDLFHRLNVIEITLPPLREREEDVLLLTEKFINIYNTQFGKSIDGYDDNVKQFLLNYEWPGNVRELQNSIERAILLTENNTLKIDTFSVLQKRERPQEQSQMFATPILPQFIRLELEYERVGLKELTVLYAKEVLNKAEGKKSKAARLLGISRPRLDSLLEKNKN
ncbi:MAG TPA: sigma-54-dependent Fis family transcriptional regulator [Ignavibacteria bacterium]|nr:sigma-54-dependent Fis family transcriptional regulator [Ignavibacteria bacterium]